MIIQFPSSELDGVFTPVTITNYVKGEQMDNGDPQTGLDGQLDYEATALTVAQINEQLTAGNNYPLIDENTEEGKKYYGYYLDEIAVINKGGIDDKILDIIEC